MGYKRQEIVWTDETIGRMWDYYEGNPAYRDQYFGNQAGRHVVYEIRKGIDFQSVKKILDFSCGVGDLVESFLREMDENQTIYGSDFSEKNVEYVRNRIKDARFGGIQLLKEYPSDYEESGFDLVLSTEVIEHLDDRHLHLMLTEANRLLKTGGYIALTTPNRENLEAGKVSCPNCGCIFHKWQHVRSWDTKSIESVLKKHGFDAMKVKTLNWAPTRIHQMVYKISELLGISKDKKGILYIGKKL